MNDYIDREVLRTYMLAGISLAETFNKDGCLNDKINAYKECLSIVDEDMPSIDALEVIRCKDCKYFEETSEIKGECTYWKVMPTIYPFKEDYCARGEKE